MSEPHSLRYLVQLRELVDAELETLLDKFNQYGAEDVLDIARLVNLVVSHKVKQKAMLAQQARDREFKDAEKHEGLSAERSRAYVEQSEPDTSSVTKAADLKIIYPAFIQDHDWSGLNEDAQDSIVSVTLGIEIPFGQWKDPRAAIVRGDQFELHRLPNMRSSYQPPTEEGEAKTDPEKKESATGAQEAIKGEAGKPVRKNVGSDTVKPVDPEKGGSSAVAQGARKASGGKKTEKFPAESGVDLKKLSLGSRSLKPQSDCGRGV